jgi:hypothetical protein
LILLAFPGLGTDANNADEGMGTLVCEITGSFPRDPPKCPGGSPLQVSGTVGNTFNWDSPNEGGGSPTEFILSQLQTADDLIAVVGHSYGGDRARLYSLFLRNNLGLFTDALIAVDPINRASCAPKKWWAALYDCIVSNPCDQSGLTYPVALTIPQRIDYVQRSVGIPNSCIQGYTLLNTAVTIVLDVSHTTIDNDEVVVHPGVSQLLSERLSTPKDLKISVTGVSISNITSTNATITWNTTKSVGNIVEYGLNQAYEGASGDTVPNKTHMVTLTGLLPSTTYHFSIVSAVSNKPKQTKDATFTTAP